MKRGVIFAGGLGLFLLAGAQEPVANSPHKLSKPVAIDKSVADLPVTEAEARQMFTEVASALKVITAKNVAVPKITIADSSNLVTRTEVIQQMDALYAMAKPYFKLTPVPVRYDPTIITIQSGAAKTSLEKLIKGGFVDRVSNLATSQGQTIGIADFGDAVGIFVARIADVAHMPSTQYSPNLEEGFGRVHG